MITKNIVEGLQIMIKYDEDDYSLCAEHDQIWCGPHIELSNETKENEHGEEKRIPEEPCPIPLDDRKKLEALGWFIDEEASRYTAFV